MSFASTSRWSLDYTSQPVKTTVVSPPGYTPALTKSSKATSALIKPVDLSAMRQQKAWDLALAPAKSVPMQGFMMYMTGGGIQIFSVMSVWSCLKGAITGILSVDKAFAPFTSAAVSPDHPAPSFALQKAAFIACQLGLLGVGLWKCNQMGLLPTYDSDWLAFKDAPNYWEDVGEATSVSRGLWAGLW